MNDPLIFTETPIVTFASNTFLRVPVILQVDGSPLIEVVQTENAGYTTKFHIYHPDGSDLAVVVGSRLFCLPAGKKAGLRLHYPAGKTICELEGQTLFEIRRLEAAALSTEAELYSPCGRFIKAPTGIPLGAFDGRSREALLDFGPSIIVRNSIVKCQVGASFSILGRSGLQSEQMRAIKAQAQAAMRQMGDAEAAEFLEHGTFGLNHFEDCEIGIQLRTTDHVNEAESS